MESLNISIDEFRMIIGQQEIEKFDLYRQIVALRLENQKLNKENFEQSDLISRLQDGKLE